MAAITQKNGMIFADGAFVSFSDLFAADSFI